MADTVAKKSRIEKDWKTEEVETLIYHYESMVSPKTFLPLVLSGTKYNNT